MPEVSEYESGDERVIIIGNKPLKHYFLVIAYQFQWHKELVLHYMQYNSSTVMRIIDLYAQFGIEEVRGSRKEVVVRGKQGEPLKIIELIIKKQGRLFP